MGEYLGGEQVNGFGGCFSNNGDSIGEPGLLPIGYSDWKIGP